MIQTILSLPFPLTLRSSGRPLQKPGLGEALTIADVNENMTQVTQVQNVCITFNHPLCQDVLCTNTAIHQLDTN